MAEFTEAQGAQLLTGPIPGGSLTQDPENPQPYETAPDYVNIEDFIDALFMNLTDAENLDDILDSIRKEIPLEDIAQLLLFQAMASGKINTDLMLGCIEPTIYMLTGLATYAGITNAVLFPEDDMQDDEEDDILALEKAVGEGSVDIKDIPKPAGVSKSLMDKLKEGDY